MRVRKAVCTAILPAMLLVSLAASRAGAGCMTCDASLNCVGVAEGAKFCMQGPLTCTLAIPCYSGPRRMPDGGEDLTTWSLFEVTGAGDGATTVEPEAGELSVAEAQRSVHGGGPLVDATLAFGRDLAVILSDVAGDGFAVRRTVQAGGVRLEVLEVTADQPGRVLADAVLGERDRLQVGVRVDGRERLLVLQAAESTGANVHATVARLRASLREAAHTLPSRTEPLLRARGL